MLCGLFINQWSFFLLFLVIHCGCWIEFQKLTGLIDNEYNQRTSFHKYGIILLGCGFMMWLTNHAYSVFGVRISEVGWWLMLMMFLALPIAEVLLSKHFILKNIGYSIAGLLYISICCGLMIDVADPELNKNLFFFSSGGYNPELPVLIIISLWINDTMAYIVGSLIGKTPFSKISPKKTWEGTIGGVLLCVITISVIAYFFAGKKIDPGVMHYAAIAAIVAIAGTAGDLFESKLKRLASVKDSGVIMPGHGGFLDRFDSLLFAVPLAWLYIVWVV